jgi:hypothetical protein
VSSADRPCEPLERWPEVLGGISVVMKVDFNLPETLSAEVGEEVEELGLIMFDWIEERMLGMPAISIQKRRGHYRESLQPGLDPPPPDVKGHVAVQWLEMVNHREQDIHDTTGLLPFPPGSSHRPEVIGKPDLGMSG